MAEEIKITGTGKVEKYKDLYPQMAALLEGEHDPVANMANFCAALKQSHGFFWIGFYIVKNDELVLGPFQGPVACTRIQKGKGVCGTAWAQKRTIIVDDVDEFPGHIACSSLSKSEIVLPLYGKDQEVSAVLDIDSEQLAAFDDADRHHLQELLKLLKK